MTVGADQLVERCFREVGFIAREILLQRKEEEKKIGTNSDGDAPTLCSAIGDPQNVYHAASLPSLLFYGPQSFIGAVAWPPLLAVLQQILCTFE